MLEPALKEEVVEIRDVLNKILALLSDELTTISVDLEKVPFPGGESMTTEALVAYQSVDFSSQKLKEFSRLLSEATKLDETGYSEFRVRVREETCLEYVRNLVDRL